MKIAKPIFIIGTGRNGSTVFQHILSMHPNVAWLSGLCGRFPEIPSVNRILMGSIGIPIVGWGLKKVIRPGECYDFWEHHFPGFVNPCRDLLSEDVTNGAKERIQDVLPKMLTQKRKRLMVKITGFPRIGFLNEIFEDARFIHLLRDGRAVVNSLMNVDWWWGWQGPQNWRWGELTSSQKTEWEKHNRSFVALAGIEWKILMDAMERARSSINGDDFLRIRYEDICSDPPGRFRDIVDFCDLEWSQKFENSVRRYSLRNANLKWQKELTVGQQDILEDVIGDYLRNYGYL